MKKQTEVTKSKQTMTVRHRPEWMVGVGVVLGIAVLMAISLPGSLGQGFITGTSNTVREKPVRPQLVPDKATFSSNDSITAHFESVSGDWVLYMNGCNRTVSFEQYVSDDIYVIVSGRHICPGLNGSNALISTSLVREEPLPPGTYRMIVKVGKLGDAKVETVYSKPFKVSK